MIMRWNLISRNQEKFPYPNYYIELEKLYVLLFHGLFPGAKIELRKWANGCLGTISCEAVTKKSGENFSNL